KTPVLQGNSPAAGQRPAVSPVLRAGDDRTSPILSRPRAERPGVALGMASCRGVESRSKRLFKVGAEQASVRHPSVVEVSRSERRSGLRVHLAGLSFRRCGRLRSDHAPLGLRSKLRPTLACGDWRPQAMKRTRRQEKHTTSKSNLRLPDLAAAKS